MTLLGAQAAKEGLALLEEQAPAHLEAFRPCGETPLAGVDFVLDRRY